MPLAKPWITPTEYLAAERQARHRSEYVNGQVYALAGASRAHNLIVVNTVAELRAQLRGRPCEVYASDMRVKVEPTGMYTYPDVVGLCDEPRFEDAEVDTLLNPAVIIEVVSPSTESYDRGGKFAHYRRMASLREYVLIAQEVRRIDHYRRDGDSWVLTEFSDPQVPLAIATLGCILKLSDVYDRVEFPPAARA
jgi:Uma2 family endonuclease